MEYKTTFGDWHARASVRCKPRRLLSGEFEEGLHCFPLELAPWVRHPLVSSGKPSIVCDGLTQQLFSYLHFTDRLEHEVVNQTARRIATGSAGLDLPLEMRVDAYKIYCDEAYHALLSADLMFQIQAASDFVFDCGAGHPALEYFHSEIGSVEPEARTWLELFFVVVSETLISGALLCIPQSPNVITAVRCLVADHAEDEGRHHAFFTRVCQAAWPQMPDRLKIRVGLALPQFILNFLTPDYPAIRAFLARHLGPTQVEDVLVESYPQAALSANTKKVGRATLRMFEKAGIFELREVAEAFEEKGLLCGTRLLPE